MRCSGSISSHQITPIPGAGRLSSARLLATGFKPKKTVENAIQEIIALYQAGKLRDQDKFHNLRWMQNTVFARAAE